MDCQRGLVRNTHAVHDQHDPSQSFAYMAWHSPMAWRTDRVNELHRITEGIGMMIPMVAPRAAAANGTVALPSCGRLAERSVPERVSG
jgi:hypothetical protein